MVVPITGAPSAFNFSAIALRPTDIIPQNIDLGANLIPFTADRLAGTCLDPAQRTDRFVGLTRFVDGGTIRTIASQTPAKKEPLAGTKELPAAYMIAAMAKNPVENGTSLGIEGHPLGGTHYNENPTLHAEGTKGISTGSPDAAQNDLQQIPFRAMSFKVITDPRQKRVLKALEEAYAILSDLKDASKKRTVTESAQHAVMSLQYMITETLRTACMIESVSSGQEKRLLALQLDCIRLASVKCSILNHLGEANETAETFAFILSQSRVALDTAINIKDWKSAGTIYELVGNARFNYASTLGTTADGTNNLQRCFGDLLMAQKFLLLDHRCKSINAGKTTSPLAYSIPHFFSTQHRFEDITNMLGDDRDLVPHYAWIEQKKMQVTILLQKLYPNFANPTHADDFDNLKTCTPDLLETVSLKRFLASKVLADTEPC